MSAGIDYGMGTTNIDKETGIRYGVISQHSVTEAWCEAAEADYGKPTCPKCGNEVKEHTVEGDQWFPRYREHGCHDYDCAVCEHTLDSSDVYGDEPIGWSVDGGEYKMCDCLDSDVMVMQSPYYTFAPFCSPCVPGAGNLDGATEEGEWIGEEHGVKTYCVGHDWFEDGKAPYPVFAVATGAEVTP